MSLCYDLQKWTMVTLSSVAITMIVGLVLMQYAHGQSDFYLEAKVSESPHVIGAHNLDITKFQIQGNSQSYKEICPSGQCTTDYKDKYTYFMPPDIPQSNLMWAQVDFTLKDDITHADLGPKKKQAVEEYSANAYCDVVDIVEENGQELYYCGAANIHGSVSNQFYRDKSWTFDSSGIYDAKNYILKINGTFAK